MPRYSKSTNNRFAAKIDKNQDVIAAAFRELGASVAFTHNQGAGFPDLVVGIDGVNLLIEVKGLGKLLTPAQKSFHANWKGQVTVIRSVAQVKELVARHKKQNLKSIDSIA